MIDVSIELHHDLRKPHVILVKLIEISGELVGQPDHHEAADDIVDSNVHLGLTC